MHVTFTDGDWTVTITEVPIFETPEGVNYEYIEEEIITTVEMELD